SCESYNSACDEGLDESIFVSPRRPPRPQERLILHKSSVCSRAYFVVVMVFFHLYIINIIALLLYVHYNTGTGDPDSPGPSSPLAHSVADLDLPPDPEPGQGHAFRLSRLEGIRVGHVQRVSLVPDRKHEIRTLSLKPLLFEVPGFLTVEEGAVVTQLAQLKGLTQSPPVGASDGLDQQLSQEELFSLLDLNQDGLLEREEILSLSHSFDGTWLSAHNLREIHMGLETNPAGVLSLQDFRRLSSSVLQNVASEQNSETWSQQRYKSTHTHLHLGHGAHRTLQNIRARVARLSRLPSSLVDISEPMEVVRYEHGGYSHAHHDSNPTHPESSCTHTHLAANTSTPRHVACRYFTLLLYLNSVDGGGETSFPVADNRTYEEEALGDLSQQYCSKGNLKVKPASGTALFWYNHLSDGQGWMGELDEFSLHGDCVVTRGIKWVASVWVNIDPDQQRQARYQRLVSRQPEYEDQEVAHSDFHQDL
uniref:Fe2OG dioxygenase domain-containing protein n=1 Tax=Denticeps clupeoides TaxID=299321 RepID=A0AAY4CMX9_9TELE